MNLRHIGLGLCILLLSSSKCATKVAKVGKVGIHTTRHITRTSHSDAEPYYDVIQETTDDQKNNIINDLDNTTWVGYFENHGRANYFGEITFKRDSGIRTFYYEQNICPVNQEFSWKISEQYTEYPMCFGINISAEPTPRAVDCKNDFQPLSYGGTKMTVHRNEKSGKFQIKDFERIKWPALEDNN